MTAAESLALSLLTLAEHGRATPCQGRRRDRWTSENAVERAWAASVCVGLACPVLEVCGAVAVERKERFAVWGGRDRSARGKEPTAFFCGARSVTAAESPHLPLTFSTKIPNPKGHIMSTTNLRNAVQATSETGCADLGRVLLGLRTFCLAVDRAVTVSLLALADPEASGTLDAALVEELMESPQSVSFFATYLHSHATPESAGLIVSLTEEMVAAAAYAQPPEDTVPESWTAE